METTSSKTTRTESDYLPYIGKKKNHYERLMTNNGEIYSFVMTAIVMMYVE